MFAFCAVTSAAAGGVVGRGTVKTGGPRRGSTFRYDSRSVYGVSLPERLAEGSGVAGRRCSHLPSLEFPPSMENARTIRPRLARPMSPCPVIRSCLNEHDRIK